VNDLRPGDRITSWHPDRVPHWYRDGMTVRVLRVDRAWVMVDAGEILTWVPRNAWRSRLRHGGEDE
jgi:hypothetical protein